MTERNNPEAELSPRVADWLRTLGLEVYAEVPMYGTSIDLVGADFDSRRIVAVELKTSFSQKVIRSAHLNQLVTDESWAAAPTKPKSHDDAIETGVGLLRIHALGVTVLREPCRRKRRLTNRFVVDGVLEFCRHDEPNDVGGIACMKGRGPAQMVHARILEFQKASPEATWRDIYDAIPNHYAHAKSLQQSMGQLHKWKKVDTRIKAKP